MTDAAESVGFGGGCHWCTEAVFEALAGVGAVAQGWIAPATANDDFSEAVLLTFDPCRVGLDTLVAVHLHTHSCTADHALRGRYRSAIYTRSTLQAQHARRAIDALQRTDFDAPIITQVLPFGAFRANSDRYLHYHAQNPDRPFCQRFIAPKLALVRAHFAADSKPGGPTSAP